MRYRNLGAAGVKVSEVALGCLSFGRWIDGDRSREIFRTALDLGINLFDTANQYGRGVDTGNTDQCGESEAILGKLIQGHRHEIVLASKVNNPVGRGVNDRGLSRYHIMNAVEDSLRRLRTDRIDLYQIHRPDPTTPVEETLAALDALVRQGKVRYIGCSNHAAWQICKALWTSDRRGYAPFVSVQPEYNVLTRDIERELLPFCRAEGIAVLVYSPLARGLLSGQYDERVLRVRAEYPAGSRATKGEQRLYALFTEENLRAVDALRPIAADRGQSLAEMAFAWTLAHPAVTATIAGATRPDQLRGVVAGLEKPLTEDELDRIDRAVRAARAGA